MRACSNSSDKLFNARFNFHQKVTFIFVRSLSAMAHRMRGMRYAKGLEEFARGILIVFCFGMTNEAGIF